MSKGGSKLVIGIIAFLLGFVFAILVEIGAIFGVYWFVMNKDLDTVLATVGIKNKDEDGNCIYINTDPENGGVTNLKELLSGVKGLVYENGELSILGKSFDDISNLIPATQMVLDMFYGITDDYIELDKEAFQGKPMTELAVVLSESIMNVKTAALMEKLGMDSVIGDRANPVVKSLVAGAECEYATVTGSELRLPVMCDYYMLQEGNLDRIDYNGEARSVNGVSALPENLRDRQEELLAPSGKITDKDKETDSEQQFERYALYYVPCRVTETGIYEAEYIIDETPAERDGKTYKFQIVTYGEDTDFIAVEYNNGNFEIDFDEVYTALNEQNTDLSDRFTGYSYYEPYAREYYYFEQGYLKTVSGKNYFRNSADKMVQLDALTLYDIMTDPFAPLDSVLVADVMEGNTEVGKIFGTTTLGALLRGEGVEEIIEDLEVSTFVNNVSPTNKVMCYIAYKISDLQNNGDNTYTAVYDKDGEDEQVVTVMLDIEGKYITEVEGVDGVKVRDVAALANNMPITVLMDVNVEEPVMAYLGYGVKGIKAQTGDGYRYVGKVKDGGEDRDCYIAIDDNDGVKTIAAVWYFDGDGNRIYVGGTKVNNVADRVNGFADALTVGDVLRLDGSESQLLHAIKDTPLSGMAERIEELTVGEIISSEEIDKSSMLGQLKNTKVTELATAIDKLIIQRVYAKEVYGLDEDGDPAAAQEYHEDWLYYVREGEEGNYSFRLAGSIDNPPADSTAYDDALGHITEEEFNAGGYYTYGGAEGMWRLVLYKNGKEKAYTMNNFNNMVAACADSVNAATLTELKKAGVVNATEAQLAKKLKIVYGGAQRYVKADGTLTAEENEGVTLGEMKLADLINVVITYLAA